MTKKNLANNRTAYFNYNLIEKYEAGMVLTGAEVKAIREGKCQLKDSHVTIQNNEAFLMGAHIGRYSKASPKSPHDPERTRKLLLNKREIEHLYGATRGKNLTIVPVMLYTIGRNIKCEIALAQGKKQYQKKEQKKRHDIDRDVERTLKEMNK